MAQPVKQQFECSVCGNRLSAVFAPVLAPRCPACGGEMHDRSANESLQGYCANCHRLNDLYKYRFCDCGARLTGFSGEQPAEPQSRPAVRNPHAISKQGPSGGWSPPPPIHSSF